MARQGQSQLPPEQVEQLCRDVARGRSHAEAAAKYGVTRQDVFYHVRKHRNALAREMARDVRKVRGQVEHALKEVEREAWRGWEDSRKDTVTSSESEKAGQSTTTTSNSGNPQMLRLLVAIQELRIKLWHADAPMEDNGVTRMAGKSREDARAAVLAALKDRVAKLERA